MHKTPLVPALLPTLAALFSAAWISGACAPKLVPLPVVTSPAHPDYVYPEVPGELGGSRLSVRVERGWQFLQAGDVAEAVREFDAALQADPRFYPADAGLGYARLAEGEPAAAEEAFGRALATAPDYVPALVGRGDALVAQDRTGEATASYEAALAANASLPEVRRRLEALSFRTQQQALASARQAAAAGRLEEATLAYERAIASSPESAFLYRELASVERKRGERAQALAHARSATRLDPSDSQSWILTGDLLAEGADFEGAVAAYEKAAAIDPGADVGERLEAVRRRVALSRLPPEYAAIPGEPVVTRAQLAALIDVHLADLVGSAQRGSPVVLTDTREHWASQWILDVVGAGIMDAYPNHTFGPAGQVTRLEMAQAVRRLLDLIATRRPALARQWEAARPAIADLPFSHLGYQAASRAVASGAMRLRNGRFLPSEPVSGAEAVEIVERLEALAR